jgi:hypothetical protein
MPIGKHLNLFVGGTVLVILSSNVQRRWSKHYFCDDLCFHDVQGNLRSTEGCLRAFGSKLIPPSLQRKGKTPSRFF